LINIDVPQPQVQQPAPEAAVPQLQEEYIVFDEQEEQLIESLVNLYDDHHIEEGEGNENDENMDVVHIDNHNPLLHDVNFELL
jgi:hypothetical protein